MDGEAHSQVLTPCLLLLLSSSFFPPLSSYPLLSSSSSPSPRFRDANILMLPWRTSARAYGPYWTVKWNINVDVLIRSSLLLPLSLPFLLPGVNKDEDLEDLDAPRYQPILNVTQKHISSFSSLTFKAVLPPFKKSLPTSGCLILLKAA